MLVISRGQRVGGKKNSRLIEITMKPFVITCWLNWIESCYPIAITRYRLEGERWIVSTSKNMCYEHNRFILSIFRVIHLFDSVKRVKFLLASLLTNQIINNHGRESFQKVLFFFYIYILFKRLRRNLLNVIKFQINNLTRIVKIKRTYCNYRCFD